MLTPGFGDVRCPECGQINAKSDLQRYGVTSRAMTQIIALLLLPATILILSCRLVAIWGDSSLHAVLCLILAPAVIPAHGWAMWQLVASKVVLTRPRMNNLKRSTAAGCVVIDIAACSIVAWLFI